MYTKTDKCKLCESIVPVNPGKCRKSLFTGLFVLNHEIIMISKFARPVHISQHGNFDLVEMKSPVKAIYQSAKFVLFPNLTNLVNMNLHFL